jgi:hypothetical protein
MDFFERLEKSVIPNPKMILFQKPLNPASFSRFNDGKTSEPQFGFLIMFTRGWLRERIGVTSGLLLRNRQNAFRSSSLKYAGSSAKVLSASRACSETHIIER